MFDKVVNSLFKQESQADWEKFNFYVWLNLLPAGI